MDNDIKQQILIALAAIEAKQYDAAFVILQDIVEREEIIEWKKLVEVSNG